MEDHRFPFQDDFEQRLATLRLRADELVRQAVALQGFVEIWLGENAPGGYRKELETGLLEDPGRYPEPERRIKGFSRVAEDLTRSLSELDGQADTLAGQERQLAGAHGALKELTEEINGLTLAVEDTLQGKKATLSRVTGLTREISARTQNLKRGQESLSGTIQEAVRTMESKDQELLAVLEEMKPGVFFGDRHSEQLKETPQDPRRTDPYAGRFGKEPVSGDRKLLKSGLGSYTCTGLSPKPFRGSPGNRSGLVPNASGTPVPEIRTRRGTMGSGGGCDSSLQANLGGAQEIPEKAGGNRRFLGIQVCRVFGGGRSLGIPVCFE